MGTPPSLPFARQRLVCLVILAGILVYTAIAAYMLQTNEWRGLQPDSARMLEDVLVPFGGAIAVGALTTRGVLSRRSATAPPAERPMRRFTATLTAIAMLEGGCVLAITTWMLGGNTMPALVVAGVLFAIAVLAIPFTDPDATPA